jgi:hypothetical protein
LQAAAAKVKAHPMRSRPRNLVRSWPETVTRWLRVTKIKLEPAGHLTSAGTRYGAPAIARQVATRKDRHAVRR